MLKKSVVLGIILLFIISSIPIVFSDTSTNNASENILFINNYDTNHLMNIKENFTYLLNSTNEINFDPYNYVLTNQKTIDGDVFFTTPLNNSIYRAGDTILIKGNITGKGFKRYIIEHGQGLNPAYWHSNGINLEFNGCQPVANRTIATWNTSDILDSDFYTLRIKVRYWKSEIFSFLNPLLRFFVFGGIFDDMFSIFDTEEIFYIKNMYFDTSLKQGWPVKLKWDIDDVGENQGHYWWPGRLMPVVSDVDNDGIKEIFVIQQADPWNIVHGFEPDGSYVEGWPQKIMYDCDPDDAYPSLATPTIIDVDGDGFQEIIITVHYGIKIYNYDGTLRNEFLYHVSTQPTAEIPVVDLNHDGEFELINLHEISHGDGKYVSVTDLNGNVLGDWPQLYYNVRGPGGVYVAGAFYEAIPAVGNFDDDMDLEIVVVGPRNVFDDSNEPHDTWHVEGRIIVYNMDGSILDGFPLDIDGWILHSPAIGDINHDGYDEIVVGSQYSDMIGYSEMGFGLFVIDRFGNSIDGWPQLVGVGEGVAHNPSLADFDGDGFLEIVAGTVDQLDAVGMSTYVFNNRGEILTGWPQKTVWYSPISPTIADINSDGVCDIVLPAGSGVFPGYEGQGGIYAFNIDGTVIDGFPKITDLEADASVTIDDIDGDGKVELIGSSHDNRDCYGSTLIFKHKYSSDIYVWEINGIYNEDCVEWPMFQHDLHYSGWYPFD